MLAQFPQPDSDACRAVAAACDAEAAVVVRARVRATLPLVLFAAWRAAGRLGPRRWIPAGGAHPRGVVGHLLAALELAGQCADPPDAIVAPLGSGGTVAGLVLGVAALGWPTPVIAVRVAPRVIANRWRITRLARGAARLLAHYGVHIPPPASHSPLVVVNGLGPGYGRPTPAGESARHLAAEHGLTLDPTYSAKAFAVLGQRAAGNVRRVVFWHTFALPSRASEPGS